MVVARQKGFSFIELMIVVAIVAIVVAIAVPSYQRYVLNTKRADARAELLQITAKLQRYKIANFTFYKDGDSTTPIVLTDIVSSTVLPAQGTALYDLTLTDVTASGWVLTATPKTTGQMKGDGVLRINSQGQKCWIKGDANCALSDTSTWDER